jgi:UDP-N-acetylglucosamine--N-acetylmuramyl-(pentapeptide) pyrophosphoryl-undecaprenol N-acetylglucosamine transferase
VATIVIAAGGTAGHVVPALAVADALRARGAAVSFLGTPDRIEASLVPQAGYEIEFVSVRGLDRRNPIKAVAAAARAAAAIPAARRALGRRGANAVMGGGGYVGGTAGLAALAAGIPLVLTEADRRLGLANRLLARSAHRVCLAFPIPGRDGERYLVTGRPVPEAILTADRGAARRRFEIAAEDPCLLVFGGSLGARSINEAALDAFATDRGDRRFHVLHLTGSRDYARGRERLAAAGEPQRYTLIEYEPTLADALAASDLVLARSGGSVFELAAAGRPAILVPYPHAAAGHQAANASWMADAGAAVVIDDSELTPATIAAQATALLRDPERLRRMSTAARSLARPEAAERIAAELLEASA